MSAAAIVMVIVTILTLWGGLAAATVGLFRRPDLFALDDEVPQEAWTLACREPHVYFGS